MPREEDARPALDHNRRAAQLSQLGALVSGRALVAKRAAARMALVAPCSTKACFVTHSAASGRPGGDAGWRHPGTILNENAALELEKSAASSPRSLAAGEIAPRKNLR